MKTLKFLLIAFVVTGSTANANGKYWLNPDRVYVKKLFNPVRVSEELRGEPCKQSKITWRKPSRSALSDQRISICFVVNDNGDVTEVNVKTNDQKIKKQFEKQFFEKNFKGLEPCVINCVDIAGRN